MSDKLHRFGPDLGDGDWAVSIDPDGAGWSFSGLRVIELAAGGSVGFDTGEDEVIVLPLSGAAVVECEGEKAELRHGRKCLRRGDRLRLRAA